MSGFLVYFPSKSTAATSFRDLENRSISGNFVATEKEMNVVVNEPMKKTFRCNKWNIFINPLQAFALDIFFLFLYSISFPHLFDYGVKCKIRKKQKFPIIFRYKTHTSLEKAFFFLFFFFLAERAFFFQRIRKNGGGTL